MISFKILQENCKYQGMLKEGKKWCGKGATCWSDWRECNKENCSFLARTKKVPDKMNQISITDYLKTTR